MHDDPTIRVNAEPTPEQQQVAALFNIGLHSGSEANAPASDDPEELQRHLPQYRVRELIGRGGMGNVMKVDDPKLARTVALKVMKLGPSATEEERGRFVREATVLAKLAHPNIVPIYDLGTDDTGSPFYTMKLVKGRTLQAIIKDIRDGMADAAQQHSLGRLLGVFRKVCDAMSFAHSHGIIHRDLKPENIMVGEFGEVLVMDWGLAKFLNGEEDAGAAASSAIPSSRKSGLPSALPRWMPRWRAPSWARRST